MIDGVMIKPLLSHTDERQSFREIIRVTDDFFAEGFGQFSHAIMLPGMAKGWHIHKSQVDWWYVPVGALVLALHDLRDSSPTCHETQEILMGVFPTMTLQSATTFVNCQLSVDKLRRENRDHTTCAYRL